ncbi:MAG: 3'-5' exonuclease domain-containing protein 2 [Bacteroidales bacterium]|jgi:ribonuclease D|nr:3'-5' exonuclease domain-containing protein 2 [Bacteroidales bacterium]
MEDYLPDITAEEIKKLPLEMFRGDVFVVSDYADFQRAIAMVRRESVLGFDTETKPSFKKGRRNKVSLLQLATDKQAWLFRLSRIGLPRELVAVLENPEIVKIGLALRDDLHSLHALQPFEPRNMIDLQKIVSQYGITAQGLRKLAAIVLGVRISKSQQVTNWENPVLTESQVLYAATDAWVCYAIWKKLNSHGTKY